MILSVAVLTGHPPLWLSLVTELVGLRLIPNAAGLNILSLNMARLVGPAIAGVLIDAVGSGWVFAINAVSFLAVIAGLLTIRSRPHPRSTGPWLGAGWAGLRYVRRRPELVAVFVVFGLVATFGVNFPTTLTLFAGQVFDVGSQGLGFMSTAVAVGTIAGTLAATRRISPTVRLVAAGALLFGVSEAVTFPVAPDVAFDAWLSPPVMRRWLFASDSGDLVRVVTDPRGIDHFGTYRETDRPRR